MFRCKTAKFILLVVWSFLSMLFCFIVHAVANDHLECKNIQLFSSDFDSISTDQAIILSGAKYLAEMELAFAIDPQFQQDSIYRTSMIQKFNVEFRRLLDLGGEDAKKIYFLKREELKSTVQKKSTINLKSRATRSLEINTLAEKILDPKMVQEVFIGSRIHGLDVTKDSKYIVSGTSGKNLKVLEFKTGNLLFEIPHDDAILTVSISSDDQFLVTGSRDNKVRIINLITQKVIHTIPLGDQVFSVSISPDGKFAITGSDDHKVRIIELSSGIITKTFKIDGWPRSVSMANDLKTIVTGTSISNKIILIDSTASFMQSLFSRDKYREIQISDGAFNVKVDEDLKYLIVGEAKSLKLINYATGELIKELNSGFVNRGLAISSKNNYGSSIFATGSGDNYARLYSLVTGDLLIELLQTGSVSQVVFTADGKYLLVGTEDGFIRIYHLYAFKT
jgi:WD40 repeat protein